VQSGEFQQRLAGVETRVFRWLPAASPRAVVQIIHGMAEHAARYARLAQALNTAGIAVYAHDLPGHGPQARVRGHFADRRGWRRALATIRDAQGLVQREQPGRPLFLLGHSMGSFLLQHYLADHGGTLSGAVLSATTGDLGASRTVALTLIRAEALVRGRRHPSALGEMLSFRSYNRRFQPARTDFDWLSRDADEVTRYVADPLCGFRCTTALWIDLLEASGGLAAPQRLQRIPRTLPILLIAGSTDPVSDGGRGPKALERRYRRAGIRNVTLRVYPDGRHELFNDVCRDEVIGDLLRWIGNHSGSAGS
jgi:alpha-beta hydrolase superfamily lysophospholipase